MASSQAGNIGRVTRQEVEAGQQEFWEGEVSVCIRDPVAEDTRCDSLSEKGTKPRANTDKNYRLI